MNCSSFDENFDKVFKITKLTKSINFRLYKLSAF